MKIKSTRFGEIEVEERDIITLVSPIIGFTRFEKFILIRHSDEIPYILWLQSVEEPSLAFAVMDPFLIPDLEYEIEIPDEDVKDLGIESPSDIAVFTIISMPDGPESISINLKAPIIINLKTGRGKQIIVARDYPVRYFILKKGKEEAS